MPCKTMFLTRTYLAHYIFLFVCASNIAASSGLMSFPLWYVDVMNLIVLLDEQLGFMILLLKLLNVTVSYILLVSSLALLTCGLFFKLLAINCLRHLGSYYFYCPFPSVTLFQFHLLSVTHCTLVALPPCLDEMIKEK